jgi:hypothetical protein
MARGSPNELSNSKARVSVLLNDGSASCRE